MKWEKKATKPDGHYIYIWTATFKIGDVSFDAIGSASSKSRFFSTAHGEPIPPTEINEVNVMKAGFSNLLVNGVTRLLGLRGVSIEELKKYNINPITIQFRTFEGKTAQPQEKTQSQAQESKVNVEKKQYTILK